MQSKALIFWIALLLLFAGGTIAWYAVQVEPPPSGGDEVSYGPPLDDFQLTSSQRERFDSRSLAGQVWVASFFYSICPTVCVQQNMRMQELVDQFGSRGVKFLSITCDAEHDTPSRLQEYAQRFNADPAQWIFLTGDQQYIEQVGRDLFKQRVTYRGHSTRMVVVDRAGEIRGAFDHANPVELAQLRLLIDELLKEPAPQPADAAEGDAVEGAAEVGDSDESQTTQPSPAAAG